MAPNGMEYMWKALGVDPKKMLEDFAKFNTALQSQVSELQALRADVKALREENASLHNTIREEFSELRSDLTSHTTALKANGPLAHNHGDDNAARRSEPDYSIANGSANAEGLGGDDASSGSANAGAGGHGAGEVREIPGLGRPDGRMDA